MGMRAMRPNDFSGHVAPLHEPRGRAGGRLRPLSAAFFSALCVRAGARPFSPNSVLVVRVGVPGAAPPVAAHAALPVAVLELSAVDGALLQTLALPSATAGGGAPAAVALTLADEREGDLAVSADRCEAGLLAYRVSAADGAPLPLSGACPCAVDMAAATLAADGSVDAAPGRLDFSFVGNAAGGPGYARADGLIRLPGGGGGGGGGSAPALYYTLTGESGGCALQLRAAGEGAARATVATGWAARGMQIGGVEADRLQLYSGSGSGILRIGVGLPATAAVPRAYVIRASDGADFGGDFDFESDTVLWAVVQDAVNGTRVGVHALRRYVCTPDDAGAPCPEGGTWSRDAAADLVCTLDGTAVSMWYVVGIFSAGVPPVFFATTKNGRYNSLDDVGTNVVVRLAAATRACAVVLPATDGTVYRGVALAPDAAVCASTASASPSPAAPAPLASTSPAPATAGAGASAGAIAGAVIGALAAAALLAATVAFGLLPAAARARLIARGLPLLAWRVSAPEYAPLTAAATAAAATQQHHPLVAKQSPPRR